MRNGDELSEIPDSSGLLGRRNAGQLRAMGEPVEAGDNGNGKIGACGAREVDHGIFVGTLKKVGVDHFDLTGSVRSSSSNRRPGTAITYCIASKPGVIPD